MSWEIIKVFLTAALIVSISSLAKRSAFLAALLASLPLISVLAMIWMSAEGQSNEALQKFCYGVLYLVPPSLIFFAIFPMLLKFGWPKVAVFAVSTICTSGLYMIWIRVFKSPI